MKTFTPEERNLEAQRQTIEACARLVDGHPIRMDDNARLTLAAAIRCLRPDEMLAVGCAPNPNPSPEAIYDAALCAEHVATGMHSPGFARRAALRAMSVLAPPIPTCPACDGTKVVSQGGHDTGCNACYVSPQTLPAPGELQTNDPGLGNDWFGDQDRVATQTREAELQEYYEAAEAVMPGSATDDMWRRYGAARDVIAAREASTSQGVA